MRVSVQGPPRPLVLVGAGGLAREAAATLRAVNDQHPVYELVGIVDDDDRLHGRTVAGTSVLGPPELLERLDVQVLLCVASSTNPRGRLALAERLRLDPERFATVIHPSAVVSHTCEIGPGALLLAGVVATSEVHIGTHVVAMPGTVFTHDDTIASGATFASGVRLAGAVSVGEAAYLGAGALVRENVRIGPGAVVGMGAVVLRDVGAAEVWAGSPAQFLRPV